MDHVSLSKFVMLQYLRSAAKISLPPVSHAISLSVVPIPKLELLPTAVPTRSDHQNSVFIEPSNDSFGRLAKGRTERRHIRRSCSCLISDLEMRTGKGIDVREHSWEQWKFTQNSPFLVRSFFCHRSRGLASAREMVRMGNIENVKGGLVGRHRQ